jgi:hypothetical protein
MPAQRRLEPTGCRRTLRRGEHVRAGHVHERVPEERRAQEERRDALELRVGVHGAREVDDEERLAAIGSEPPRSGKAARARRPVEVEPEGLVGQVQTSLRRSAEGIRDLQARKRLQLRVEGLSSEQQLHELLVEPHRTREQGWIRLRRLCDEADQAVREQRGIGCEPGSGVELFLGALAEQIEH